MAGDPLTNALIAAALGAWWGVLAAWAASMPREDR